MITIKADFSAVLRKLDALHRDSRGPALASAINKTLELGRTQDSSVLSRPSST